MAEARDPAVQAMLDKQAIHDVLVRYCRGVDRCDLAMLKSAYWPDAVDDHGTFNGNAMEFCETLIPALKGMDQTMHAIGNVHMELHGDKAKVETYCTAYHYIPGPDGHVDMIAGGRYLDRMEKRNGEWRIAYRLYVMDWNQNMPATAQWDEGIFAMLKTRGKRHPDDPWDTFEV